MSLYTKNGKPLHVVGSKVYSKSGKIVGKISGNKVFGPNGRYVGTIVNDRLVYRSTHSSSVGSTFSSGNRGGIGKGNRGSAGVWGEEPKIPD